MFVVMLAIVAFLWPQHYENFATRVPTSTNLYNAGRCQSEVDYNTRKYMLNDVNLLSDKDELFLMKGCYQFAESDKNTVENLNRWLQNELRRNKIYYQYFNRNVTNVNQVLEEVKKNLPTSYKGQIYAMITQVPVWRDENYYGVMSTTFNSTLSNNMPPIIEMSGKSLIKHVRYHVWLIFDKYQTRQTLPNRKTKLILKPNADNNVTTFEKNILPNLQDKFSRNPQCRIRALGNNSMYAGAATSYNKFYYSKALGPEKAVGHSRKDEQVTLSTYVTLYQINPYHGMFNKSTIRHRNPTINENVANSYGINPQLTNIPFELTQAMLVNSGCVNPNAAAPCEAKWSKSLASIKTSITELKNIYPEKCYGDPNDPNTLKLYENKLIQNITGSGNDFNKLYYMFRSELRAILHPEYPNPKYIRRNVRTAVKIGYHAFFEKVRKGPDIPFCKLPRNLQNQVSGQFSMECMQGQNDYDYDGQMRQPRRPAGPFRPAGPAGPPGPQGPNVGNSRLQNRPTKPPGPTEPVTLWHI
jgi:hypothetical protein